MKLSQVLGFVLLSTMPAHAQDVSTGTLIPDRDASAPVQSTGRHPRLIEGPLERQSTDAAIATARATARCAIEKQSDGVQDALKAADWRSFILATQKLSSTMGRCAGKVAQEDSSKVELGFGAQTYFGVLAEAWLMRKGTPPLEPVAYTVSAPSFAWLDSSAGGSAILRLADCLAHKEPQRVDALVRSTPLSAQESAGFASIQPALPACLDSNVTLSATKTKLRLALATAMYRRSINISPGQQVEALR